MNVRNARLRNSLDPERERNGMSPSSGSVTPCRDNRRPGNLPNDLPERAMQDRHGGGPTLEMKALAS